MGLKKLGSDFLFYGLLDVIQRSVSVFLVPLYTRTLSQSDFGNLDMFLVLISVLSVLIDFQFATGISRLYGEFVSRCEDSRFMGSILVLRFVIGILIALVALIIGLKGMINFNFIPLFDENLYTWILVLLFVPISLTFEALITQTRMLRSKRSFAAGTMISTLFTLFGSFISTVFTDLGATGIIGSMLLGRMFAVVVLYLRLIKKIQLCLDWKILSTLFSYCMPLIPGWWLAFSSTYISRFFVFGSLGPNENALLAVSMKILNVVGIVAISFRSAWFPIAMNYVGDSKGDEFFSKSMRFFMSVTFCSTFIFTIFIKPLLSIFAPNSYSEVGIVFSFFAIGSLIGEIESNLQLGAQIAKKTIWISIGSLLSFIVTLFILDRYTMEYGLTAAGLALLFSALVKFCITFFSSQHYNYIPYENKSFIYLFIGCVILLFQNYVFSYFDLNFHIWNVIQLIFGIIISIAILTKKDQQLVVDECKRFFKQYSWVTKQ